MPIYREKSWLLQLDSKQAAPLYLQLVEQVIAQVDSGALKPESKLPTSRDLASSLRLNRNTVVKAYHELARRGYLKSRVGSGTIVMRPQPGSENGSRSNRQALAWSSMLSRAAQRLPHRETHSSTADSIRLSRMQPSADLLPLKTFAEVIDSSLKNDGGNSLIYAPSSGISKMREVVAAELSGMGVNASVDEIIITNGSSQALDLTLRALIDPGDKILLEDPTYHGGIMLLKLSGAELIPIPSDDEGPDLKRLPITITRETKACYIIPNYRNPTSTSISEKRRQEIAAWAKAHNILIIEDDYASELSLDSAAPKPIKHFAPDHCIYLNSFSKRLFPALRLGYMAIPKGPLTDKLHTMKWTIDLGCSALLQSALAEFIQQGHYKRHLQFMLNEYRKRREVMNAVLKETMPAEVQWEFPKGGLFFWLSFPNQVNVERLIANAAANGVEVSGGHVWSATGSNLSGIRITFCSESPERIEKGIRLLASSYRQLIRETHNCVNKANLSDNYV